MQDEPVMQTSSHESSNNYGMSGAQNYAQHRAQTHVPKQMYSPRPMAEAQSRVHLQTYFDPRMVPLAAYQTPMPQAFFTNGQPAPMYPNVIHNPAASQHVFVQSIEQEVHPSKSRAQEGMSPAQQNGAPETGSIAEYQRLHSEIQRVSSRLESWVDQNNQDGKDR